MRRRGFAGGLIALFVFAGAIYGVLSLNWHFRHADYRSTKVVRILPGEFPNAPRLSASNKAEALRALKTTWFTDGNEGYFLDSPTGMQNVFSLYDTLWWSRYAHSAGRSPELVPSEMSKWLLPLTQLRSLGTADTVGAPEMAVLDASVALARDYRLKDISPGKIAVALESLRLGSKYKSSRSAPAGDWASTATAIRTLISLGEPIPNQVKTLVGSNIARGQTSRTIDQISVFILPILSASINLGESVNGWQATVDWLRSVSSSLPIEESVAITAQIHEASPAFRGLATPAELCKRFNDSVSANIGRADPHLFADAAEIGCATKTVAIPAASPGGWPNPQAQSRALVDTYYGALLARSSGVLAHYTRQIAKFNADGTAQPLFSLISGIVGCSDSTCRFNTGASITDEKSLIPNLEVCIMRRSIGEHQKPSSNAFASVNSRNQFVRMIVEELKARCYLSPSDHAIASRIANQFSTGHSLELISAKSWVLGEPLPPVAASSGYDLGILERMVLANWNYTDTSSMPALAF